MKKILNPLFVIFLMTLYAWSASAASKATFFINSTDSNCSAFNLTSEITLTGVKVTSIYYDNGSHNGSTFAYLLYFSVKNTFEGAYPSTSTGNFYRFVVIFNSTNPQIQLLRGNVDLPLRNGEFHNISIGNNPTFYGSARALGLAENVLYTDPQILDLFQYNQVTLDVQMPCLAYTKLEPFRQVYSDVPSNPLPICLKKFDVVNYGNGVLDFFWTTSLEHNNEKFIIEKSLDGINWNPIAVVPTQAEMGNSTTDLHYQFTSINNYESQQKFRLKQVDIDGGLSFSKILNVCNNKSSQVSIYPNPFTNELFIKGISQNSSINIYNLTGMLVPFEAIWERNRVKINTALWDNGIYFIQKNDGSNSEIIKIIKQK